MIPVATTAAAFVPCLRFDHLFFSCLPMTAGNGTLTYRSGQCAFSGLHLPDLRVRPSSITIQSERYHLEAKGATLVGFPRLV